MAKIERFFLHSRRDHTRLPALIVRPDGLPRAIVQISHGMCEYKDRYLPFLEYLADAGYVSIINDHRGHGQIARENGDLGYFGDDGANALVDDLFLFTEHIRALYPDLPLFLFGHSMGSLAVRAYVMRNDTQLHGLFVCGSPADNAFKGIGRAIARAQASVKGAHYRSKILKYMTFGPFYRAFPSDKCAWLCSDPQVVAAYNADPLCGFSFTCNGYDALYQLIGMAYRADIPAKNPQMPVHFLSGALDPCKSSKRGFENAVKRMRLRGYKNVTATVYPAMRHEILNEIGHEKVWADVLDRLNDWMDKK